MQSTLEVSVTMDQRQRLVSSMAQFCGMKNSRRQHRDDPHRRTNSFARQWNMQFVTLWPYRSRRIWFFGSAWRTSCPPLVLVIVISGLVFRFALNTLQILRASISSLGVFYGLTTLIYAVFMRHRGMYHSFSLTQNGKEHPEIELLFLLMVLHAIFFPLSAANSSITTYLV